MKSYEVEKGIKELCQDTETSIVKPILYKFDLIFRKRYKMSSYWNFNKILFDFVAKWTTCV
jgi:hypothetical protein